MMPILTGPSPATGWLTAASDRARARAARCDCGALERRSIRSIDEGREIERQGDVLGRLGVVEDVADPAFERRRRRIGDRQLRPGLVTAAGCGSHEQPALGRAVQQAPGRAVDFDRERREAVDEAVSAMPRAPVRWRRTAAALSSTA